MSTEETVAAQTRPTADDLMAEAMARTGLSDFGGPSVPEGLAKLIHAYDTEMTLNDQQSARYRGIALERLINRLEIEDYWKAHPELATQEIAGPVSIMGLPRTGTTALCNIMSLDTQFRSLRMWEQPRSCPPPTPETERDDPRRQAAIDMIESIRQNQPELMAMHLWDPDVTEEDVEVLATDFHAQQLATPIYGYHTWWRTCDMRPTFKFHRRVLQLLQSKRPPNLWLLKAPAHNFHIEAIVDAYPDIKFIMTHRDPGKAVPSSISLVAALMPPGALTERQIADFGRHHAEHLRIGVERAMAARERIGEDRFLDVHHHDFVADPFGTLERIYAYLGLEWHPETRRKMETWHEANRSGAHGKHHYTAEQYGLTEDGVRQDFAPYIERFGVKVPN